MNTNVKTKEIFNTLLQQADQGDTAACATVGHVYAAGDEALGIGQNRTLAMQYYDKGAQAGDFPCMFGLAGCYLQDDPGKAIALLETCAAGKHLWSLATLGDFYLRGRHVPQDAGKAFTYLQEYTTLCRPERVGAHTFKVRWDLVLYPLCLLLGVGCAKDEGKATEVLTELAKLGNLSAADILLTGKLNDWMAAKRFNYDTRANGPVTLFQTGRQLQALPQRPAFTTSPRVHRAQYEVFSKEHLSRFFQRALSPDERILMRGVFPRIYIVDSYLVLFLPLFLGRWIEHLMALHSDAICATMPYRACAWLYDQWHLPLIICGAIGTFFFLRRMIKSWTTEIVLTDRRFLYKRGLFSIEMIQMNFWQIEHSDVRQSMLGSFLDYGQVHIQSYAMQSREDPTVQQGILVLPQISHPFLFTRLIEDNRQLPYKNAGGATAVPVWRR